LALLMSISSYASSYDKLYCRNVGDLRKIVKLQGDTVLAAVDEYEDWEQVVQRRYHVMQTTYSLQAQGFIFRFDRSQAPLLSKKNIDGDTKVLFRGRLEKGLSKSYQGEYVCILNGYLALTIQGHEPDGGYSISVNY
ncbi:MAG: hypothetical protein KDD45_06870, partial [Bdellovibrionales bacterium]|nr:hypothetical protein [Bdellovibrionales bacterium]